MNSSCAVFNQKLDTTEYFYAYSSMMKTKFNKFWAGTNDIRLSGSVGTLKT